MTILEDDSEDFEKGTTLSMHKSLTNLHVSASDRGSITHFFLVLSSILQAYKHH